MSGHGDICCSDLNTELLYCVLYDHAPETCLKVIAGDVCGSTTVERSWTSENQVPILVQHAGCHSIFLGPVQSASYN